MKTIALMTLGAHGILRAVPDRNYSALPLTIVGTE